MGPGGRDARPGRLAAGAVLSATVALDGAATRASRFSLWRGWRLRYDAFAAGRRGVRWQRTRISLAVPARLALVVGCLGGAGPPIACPLRSIRVDPTLASLKTNVAAKLRDYQTRARNARDGGHRDQLPGAFYAEATKREGQSVNCRRRCPVSTVKARLWHGAVAAMPSNQKIPSTRSYHSVEFHRYQRFGRGNHG